MICDLVAKLQLGRVHIQDARTAKTFAKVEPRQPPDLSTAGNTHRAAVILGAAVVVVVRRRGRTRRRQEATRPPAGNAGPGGGLRRARRRPEPTRPTDEGGRPPAPLPSEDALKAQINAPDLTNGEGSTSACGNSDDTTADVRVLEQLVALEEASLGQDRAQLAADVASLAR